MKLGIGIWLDHFKAIIVSVSDEDVRTEVLHSDAEPHIRAAGGYGRGAPSGAQDVMKEDRFDERRKHAADAWYARLAERVAGAQHVLIEGPAEARLEFGKKLANEASFTGRIDDVRPADKMTNAQFEEVVRKHFNVVRPRVNR